MSRVASSGGVLQRRDAAVQVLQLRAQAYVLNKQAADVQIDVERVRLPQAPDDDSPSLHLAAMKALIQVWLCSSECGPWLDIWVCTCQCP